MLQAQRHELYKEYISYFTSFTMDSENIGAAQQWSTDIKAVFLEIPWCRCTLISVQIVKKYVQHFKL